MTNDKNTSEATVEAFCAGRVYQFIRDYAESAGISADEFTHRVAESILATSRRPLVGFRNNLPEMRRAPAETYSIRSAALALARSPRVTSTSPMKGHSYNGKHWTQLPKNKKRLREIARRNGAARLGRKMGPYKRRGEAT